MRFLCSFVFRLHVSIADEKHSEVRTFSFCSVSGNPLMCDEGEKNCYRSKDQKVIVIGSSVAAAMLLAVILLVTVAILCKRRRNYTGEYWSFFQNSKSIQF
eukprot:TRINITY_DN2456_c0_g1_i6.p1 TRINITY_DN2456_c0_g1~~TRINITY_DN2456_c0_g1_i6.p1  ORF type:complete len:101 (-),score=7.73 TRINITY_DN2456_c0_g1_i6:92-394(-)